MSELSAAKKEEEEEPTLKAGAEDDDDEKAPVRTRSIASNRVVCIHLI